MTLVILIGDSIRMSYQPHVTAMLEGEATVIGPEPNCSNSRWTLRHFDQWVVGPAREHAGPVVLHINCGLHDLAHKRLEQGNVAADSPDVPLDAYRANVAELLRRATADAGIAADQIIWATTTPVIDAWHNAGKGFNRHNEDVLRYNAAAVEVASAAGCRVNDLYAVVQGEGPQQMLEKDGVHYTAVGTTRLAKAVASAVRAADPVR